MTFREAARELLRATVVQSMRRLLEARPWHEITMKHIADEAGVSRQTIYNEFGGRDGLVRAYALDTCQAFLAEVAGVVAANLEDVDRAVVIAIERFLDTVADDPLVRSIADKEGVSGVAELMTAVVGDAITEAAAAGLVEIVGQVWPSLPGEDVELGVDTLVRLAISHIIIPTGTHAAAAASVGRTMSPYLRGIWR